MLKFLRIVYSAAISVATFLVFCLTPLPCYLCCKLINATSPVKIQANKISGNCWQGFNLMQLRISKDTHAMYCDNLQIFYKNNSLTLISSEINYNKLLIPIAATQVKLFIKKSTIYVQLQDHFSKSNSLNLMAHLEYRLVTRQWRCYTAKLQRNKQLLKLSEQTWCIYCPNLYKLYPTLHGSITGKGTYGDNQWDGTISGNIPCNDISLQEIVASLQGSDKHASIAIKGKVTSIYLPSKDFKSNVDLQWQNKLIVTADMLLGKKSTAQANIAYDNNNIKGKILLNYEEEDEITLWHLDSENINAMIQATIDISGKPWNPSYHLSGDLTQGYAKYSQLNLQASDIKLKLTSNNIKKLNFVGSGKLNDSRNRLSLQGYLNFGDKQTNHVSLTCPQTTIHVSPKIELTTAVDTAVTWQTNDLSIIVHGNIDVFTGNIEYSTNPSIEKTADVVFTDNYKKKPQTQDYILKPNLTINILQPIDYYSNNINGKISGNLHLTHKNQQILANGRVSIKQGYFYIAGQNFTIKQGRAKYDGKTSLYNPYIDLILENPNNKTSVIAQGFLQDPHIQESGLTGDSNIIVTHIAHALSSMVTNKKISKFLNKAHVSLKNINNTQDVTVDYKLSEKLSTSISITQNTKQEQNNSVYLFYKLSPYWSIGLGKNNEFNKENTDNTNTYLSAKLNFDYEF